MDKNDFKKTLLTRILVEIGREWQRNFDRRAFFSTPWKDRQNPNAKQQTLDASGALRRSLRGEITDNGVRWYSPTPYAAIHNDGGTITVTAQMKRFFWAKYYELAGNIKYNKDGKTSKGTEAIAEEAMFYKSLALMKIGSKIEIPRRRFIGDAPEVRSLVKKITDETVAELEKYLLNILKPKK
jgi:phage gpG-like protein